MEYAGDHSARGCFHYVRDRVRRAGALFGESDALAGVATIIASVVVIAGDLLYFRRGDDPELGRWRYVSLDSGGVVGFVPAWVFGIVAFGCGIALIVQGLN